MILSFFSLIVEVKSTMASSIIKLPNIFEKIKLFELRKNPNLETITEECFKWIEKLSLIYQKKIHLHRLDYTAAYMFPDADIKKLKIAADYLNIYTLIDDLCCSKDVTMGVISDVKSAISGEVDENSSELGKALKRF